MARNMLGRIIPRGIRVFVMSSYILAFKFGQAKTAQRRTSTDKLGRPIPWYTYPAIEYLGQLDFSGKRVFEYGSGNSTLYWSERCRAVTSVEDDEKWHGAISKRIPRNVQYDLILDKTGYVDSINAFERSFDVVVIDGSHRYECAIEAVNMLSSDGIIILDNSDWHPNAAEYLREASLIQVDMFGFGPINHYTWATSLFLTPKFRPKLLSDRQPISGIGSLHHTQDV